LDDFTKMLTGIPFFILVISVSETIALTSNLEAPRYSLRAYWGGHIAFFHVSIGHPEMGLQIVKGAQKRNVT
jgi:hypothetical protein